MSMTLGQVIALVDETKPNAFSGETKTLWLNECEGLIQTEVWLVAVEDVVSYRYAEDQETVLLVEAPHCKLYEAYLSARIDYANGEYQKYQNTMQMFNEFYQEYMRWYASRYRPADRRTEPWKGYYFTAYGIAVKHGFTGTEEQWLESGDVQLRYDAQENQLQWKLRKDGQWNILMELSELQGQVVAQTLREAAEAAQTAKTSAERAAAFEQRVSDDAQDVKDWAASAELSARRADDAVQEARFLLETAPSLGITEASPGQIIRVAAVDGDGKPAKWEASDLPAAGTGASVAGETLILSFGAVENETLFL